MIGNASKLPQSDWARGSLLLLLRESMHYRFILSHRSLPAGKRTKTAQLL